MFQPGILVSDRLRHPTVAPIEAADLRPIVFLDVPSQVVVEPEPDGRFGLSASAFRGRHADHDSRYMLEGCVCDLSVPYALVADARHRDFLAGTDGHVEIAIKDQT